MSEQEPQRPDDNSLDEPATAGRNTLPPRVVVAPPRIPFGWRTVIVLMRVWTAILFLGAFILLAIGILTLPVEQRPFVFETHGSTLRLGGWATPMMLAMILFLLGRVQNRFARGLRARLQLRVALAQ